MRGQVGIFNPRPDARLSPFPGIKYCMDDLITESTLIRNLCVSLMCMACFFWHFIHGCLYNQALADVRSTGAGIKYLYNVPDSHHSCGNQSDDH